MDGWMDGQKGFTLFFDELEIGLLCFRLHQQVGAKNYRQSTVLY
jgi:hypothetical protein